MIVRVARSLLPLPFAAALLGFGFFVHYPNSSPFKLSIAAAGVVTVGYVVAALVSSRGAVSRDWRRLLRDFVVAGAAAWFTVVWSPRAVLLPWALGPAAGLAFYTSARACLDHEASTTRREPRNVAIVVFAWAIGALCWLEAGLWALSAWLTAGLHPPT